MPFIRYIQQKTDPVRLILSREWLVMWVLTIITGLLFAATVLLAILGDKAIRRTDGIYAKVQDTDKLADRIHRLHYAILNYKNNLHAYLLYNESAKIRDLQNSQSEIVKYRSELIELTLPAGKAHLDTLILLEDSVFSIGNRALNLLKSEGKEAALVESALIDQQDFINRISMAEYKILQTRVGLLNEQSVKNDDFSNRFLRISLYVVATLAGIVLLLLANGIVRVVRKVIAERQAYMALFDEQKKATELARNLMNIAPIGYLSINADGIILDVNQTELAWVGYTLDEVVGKKHITELTDDASGQRFSEQLAVFKREGHLSNFEVNLLSKDGRLIPILLNAKAIYDADGNFSHSITLSFNFTERKKMENELIKARQEAEFASQFKRLFMANMSHEIRTPLNAILGFANLLARADLPPEQKEYVASIQISGNNLLTIVNDILDFEKIRSGMLRIEQVDFDLPGLLHSVVTMVGPSASERSLKLHLEMDEHLPTPLVGDPMRLTQILINLLGNAIKFTEMGSVTLRVSELTQGISNDRAHIRFEIIDTGIGIPASEHSRIFERFIQASSDTTRKYGGTGLGLALVKMLVEIQQGAVHVASRVGHGSTFAVEIPYFKAQPDTMTNVSIGPENLVIPDLSGFHILLVEDNPMNRRIAELYLLELGLSVTMAVNGLEAVEQLRVKPMGFDLILMDIQMPEMDGYQATQAIRTELGLKSIPIISMTAHVLAGEREKVMAGGMNDYLTKPVNHKDLVGLLLRYLPVFWDGSALWDHVRSDPAGFLEIVRLFIRQFPQDLDVLNKAIASGNFATVASTAHSLRSSAGYAGFQTSLGDLLARIEKESLSQQPDAPLIAHLGTVLTRKSLHAVTILQREIPGEVQN